MSFGFWVTNTLPSLSTCCLPGSPPGRGLVATVTYAQGGGGGGGASRHIQHSPQHTNDGALRTRKRHQQEH